MVMEKICMNENQGKYLITPNGDILYQGMIRTFNVWGLSIFGFIHGKNIPVMNGELYYYKYE